MVQKNIGSARTSRTVDTILCLSIRQPYAMWLSNPALFESVNVPIKAIENREWNTPYRGPLLIHASKTFEHEAINYWIDGIFPELATVVPLLSQGYPTGAIVGIADLVDVVWRSNDPWFVGSYGFVLANARPLKPIPYRGQLKLFPVPRSIVEE
jgi:hypothetical protein